VKLLVVTPDYLSHYLPLSAVAAEAVGRGIEVTVATGDGLADRVRSSGCAWAPLRMSRGSNTGIKRVDDPDDDLRAFMRATAEGMVPTLLQQAAARGDDLLWNPVEVGRAALDVVDRVAPDAVLVDHLAFATTMALRAGGVPFTTFVPGHPSQLPAPGERYGSPIAWPSCEHPDPGALAELRARCDEVTATFTASYRQAAGTIGAAPDIDDAFAAHGTDVLYNSPGALHPPGRPLPARHAFLGACVRADVATPDVQRWLDRDDGRPVVYVSFGTFLSARADVLHRVLGALATMDVRVAVATGSAALEGVGATTDQWLVAPELPQVAILRHADAVVTHAGNNTVTESLAAGCPLVALPFSTDQFAIAADLERTGLGVARDPNRATASALVDAATWALAPEAQARAGHLAAELAAAPGPVIAVDRLVAGA